MLEETEMKLQEKVKSVIEWSWNNGITGHCRWDKCKVSWDPQDFPSLEAYEAFVTNHNAKHAEEKLKGSRK